MKKLTALLLLILSPNLSFASSAITCQSLSGEDKSLLLLVKNNKVVQLRVQSQGSLPKVFKTNSVRNNGTVSVYSLVGSSSLLEVQNSTLDGQGGRARFSGQRFECDSN